MGMPKNDAARALFLEILLDGLESETRDIYLVLDDFHLVKEEPIRKFLLFLIKQLPEQFRLIIMSRSEVFEGQGKAGARTPAFRDPERGSVPEKTADLSVREALFRRFK